MTPTNNHNLDKIIITSLVMAAVIGGIYFLTNRKLTTDSEPVINQEPPSNHQVSIEELTKEVITARIKTEEGDIVLNLYPKAAPKTVENFVNKARRGYFNGLKFHRVEDWVVQGGDPLSRDEAKKEFWGTGGGNLDTELSPLPFVAGALGVARGPDIRISNDSQFFIVKKNSPFLNGQYTLFGQVIAGLTTVNKIKKGDTIISLVIE